MVSHFGVLFPVFGMFLAWESDKLVGLDCLRNAVCEYDEDGRKSLAPVYGVGAVRELWIVAVTAIGRRHDADTRDCEVGELHGPARGFSRPDRVGRGRVVGDDNFGRGGVFVVGDERFLDPFCGIAVDICDGGSDNDPFSVKFREHGVTLIIYRDVYSYFRDGARSVFDRLFD